MYYFKLATLAIVAMICWLSIVIVSAFYGVWMRPIAPAGDSAQFFKLASDKLKEENHGNSALMLFEDGKLTHQFYSNSPTPVDQDTVFLTASMSKWFTAYGVMKLIEDGNADLDTPVSQYLTRWQLPQGEFDNDEVTIRRLLSHTAGFTDGLGFGDYEADEDLPSLEQSLSNPRASSGREVELAVALPPGTEWRYSGGSYLLLELLVEEISGQTFQRYMQDSVFQPLNMTRSSYGFIGDLNNNAGSYDREGGVVPNYKYASNGATAFVTSPADLSKFVLSQFSGDQAERPVSSNTIKAMREPHGRMLGADIWGLGTILYGSTESGDSVFGHDGGNDPAINTTARINPDTDDAIIVLLTGHPSLATNIGSEWVLWQTGYPDVLDFDSVIASTYLPALFGIFFLLLLAYYMHYRHSKIQSKDSE